MFMGLCMVEFFYAEEIGVCNSENKAIFDDYYIYIMSYAKRTLKSPLLYLYLSDWTKSVELWKHMRKKQIYQIVESCWESTP